MNLEPADSASFFWRLLLIASLIAAAVSQANSSPAAPPPVPLVPPLSAAEKDGLRVAVEHCWNVGSLSTAALQVTVTVGVSMAEDGRPKMETIKMLSFTGGSRAGALRAFAAARRAIIICGRTGYALPRAKYAQWRNIEMVFDPQKMRIK